MFELGQLPNVYFLELKDLSNPKFLEWLKSKGDDWEVVQEIPYKNVKSNTILEKQLNVFWKEYYSDDILPGRKLFNPLSESNFSFNTFTNPKRVLGGDIDAHSFLLHTIPVKNFTPINMLKFILNSQQKEVDYIRKFNKRYITL